MINIINAILYVCGEGIKWRALPADFGIPWQTVYWYFTKWNANGSWEAINQMLVMNQRQRSGAEPLATTVIIDSQTVKNTPTATDHIGTDGGKKIKGRKRMMLVDSIGNLLAVKVFEANRHDGPAALGWWREHLAADPFFGSVRLIKGDQHFGGRFKKGVERETGIQVRVSHELVKKVSQLTMPVHKGRWVVERSIAWASNCRRLAKDYERLPEHSEAFIMISSIIRILNNPICLN